MIQWAGKGLATKADLVSKVGNPNHDANGRFTSGGGGGKGHDASPLSKEHKDLADRAVNGLSDDFKDSVASGEFSTGELLDRVYDKEFLTHRSGLSEAEAKTFLSAPRKSMGNYLNKALKGDVVQKIGGNYSGMRRSERNRLVSQGMNDQAKQISKTERPIGTGFDSRSSYAAKQAPVQKCTMGLSGMLKPKKFTGAQAVPMNAAAISASLTAANS